MSDLMNPAKPEIKNIIFDLGGVLLNIDPRITGRRLEEFGVANMEELHHKLMDVRLYKRFDSGACSPERFYEEIRELSGISLTDNQIEEAWNALLLDFPYERVNMLHQLSENYRLFLLSNTNSIHYRTYTQKFREVHGEEMPSLFEKLFLSYEMGCSKPDPAIFRKALIIANLKAEETLFIDDMAENVEAAVKEGLKACHLGNGTDVTGLFINGKLRPEAELFNPRA